MSSSNSKYAFFRQSGWMVIATFAGGIFMTLVHTAAVKMGQNDYAVFNALLRLLIVLSVPAAGLQTVFAQQAAAAVTEEKKRDLMATTRAVLRGTFIFWIVTALLAFVFTSRLSRFLDVGDPAALQLTILVVLPGLMLPMIKGLLQGMHSFAGLGWLQIIDGVGRFAAVLVIILIFKGQAAGAMLAVFAGQFGALLIGIWLTRSAWADTPVKRHDWKQWLGRVTPLTMGMGSTVAMTCIDSLFVQSRLGHGGQTDLYMGGMITGYAIIQFIAPVAAVMFPKIVRSAALSEKSDALLVTVLVTAVFGCLAAIGSTLLPWLPLRVIYFSKPHMWEAAFLVPWFAWALLPWTMGNVLVQNLMARERFEAAPWLMMVPVVYTATLFLAVPALRALPPFAAFVRVTQILGLFNLALFGIAAWFTWRKPKTNAAGRDSAAARAVSDKSTLPPERKVS